LIHYTGTVSLFNLAFNEQFAQIPIHLYGRSVYLAGKVQAERLKSRMQSVVTSGTTSR
jgi:hypothetical protein